MIFVAPRSLENRAALQRVPAVSVRSSTMMTSLALDFADHVQRLDLGRALSALGDDREAGTESLRIGGGHLQTAHIRRHHHRVENRFRAEIANDDRSRVEVIDRDVEKSCDLLRVEIHRQDAIDASSGEEIRDQLGGDRHAWLILPILPGVSEKWNHRGDPRRAGPPGRVDHDQQLHQILIGRRAGRLNDEDIPAADVFVDLHVGLPIGKGC